MRAPHLPVIGLLSSLLLSGCSDVTSPNPKLDELNANRLKWAANGFTNYAFTLRAECFCAYTDPVSILVVSDSVRQVTIQSSGEVINAPWMPSIKKLFDIIEADINRPAAVLDVTYDPVLGYPTHIVSDPIANAVDDEVTYTVTNVNRLIVDPVVSATPTESHRPLRRVWDLRRR